MKTKRYDIRTFQLAPGTTVTYFNICAKCQGELGDPTRTGMLTCADCGEEKRLSLLGNKF